MKRLGWWRSSRPRGIASVRLAPAGLKAAKHWPSAIQNWSRRPGGCAGQAYGLTDHCARSRSSWRSSANIGIKPALVELREDAALLAFHVAQLPPPRDVRPDTIDANLAVARPKVEASETFEQGVAHLSSREAFSILNDGAVLSALLQKR
jgi:hypothetical protein